MSMNWLSFVLSRDAKSGLLRDESKNDETSKRGPIQQLTLMIFFCNERYSRRCYRMIYPLNFHHLPIPMAIMKMPGSSRAGLDIPSLDGSASSSSKFTGDSRYIPDCDMTGITYIQLNNYLCTLYLYLYTCEPKYDFTHVILSISVYERLAKHQVEANEDSSEWGRLLLATRNYKVLLHLREQGNWSKKFSEESRRLRCYSDNSSSSQASKFSIKMRTLQ